MELGNTEGQALQAGESELIAMPPRPPSPPHSRRGRVFYGSMLSQGQGYDLGVFMVPCLVKDL